MKEAVNNIEHILPFVDRLQEGEFLWLQIIKRKKDNKETVAGSRSNSTRTICTYYVRSRETLLDKMGEIIAICDVCNARAMITLQPKSGDKVNILHNHLSSQYLLDKQIVRPDRVLSKSVGNSKVNVGEPLWVIDVDWDSRMTEEDRIEAVDDITRTLERLGVNKDKPVVMGVIPSQNGVHIVTTKFDSRGFKKDDIKKHALTNLYIPAQKQEGQDD